MNVIGTFKDLLLSPRGREDERRQSAAKLIQRHARGMRGRRHAQNLRWTQQYMELIASTERRATILLQKRWRAHVQYREMRALVLIQAAAKGSLQRWRLNHERTQAATQAERRAEERARLMCECTAILEKQGRRYSLGKWEMVIWQDRYVYVNHHALVYQHIKSNAEPTGAQRMIPFAAMETITAQLNDRLVIRCRTRSYVFQLGSREEVERWATNLVHLAADAGYHVDGFLDMPHQEEDGP